MALAAATALTLSGCAGPEFAATQAKSKPIVEKLYAEFDLAGYTVGPIDGGHWGPDSGGDPNYWFSATHTTDHIEAAEQCKIFVDYAFKLSPSSIIDNTGQKVSQKQASADCTGELLSAYMSGYSIHASFEKTPVLLSISADRIGLAGEKTSVPTHYTVNVSTEIVEGTSGIAGCPECLMEEKLEPTLSAYLNTLQDYRAKNGFEFFDEKKLSEAGAIAQTAKAQMTPIADADGLIRRVGVHFTNGSMLLDQCYSLMPWDARYWGIDDPGSPRPLMAMAKLADLHSFGQYVMSSDCVKDPQN